MCSRWYAWGNQHQMKMTWNAHWSLFALPNFCTHQWQRATMPTRAYIWLTCSQIVCKSTPKLKQHPLSMQKFLILRSYRQLTVASCFTLGGFYERHREGGSNIWTMQVCNVVVQQQRAFIFDSAERSMFAMATTSTIRPMLLWACQKVLWGAVYGNHHLDRQRACSQWNHHCRPWLHIWAKCLGAICKRVTQRSRRQDASRKLCKVPVAHTPSWSCQKGGGRKCKRKTRRSKVVTKLLDFLLNIVNRKL